MPVRDAAGTLLDCLESIARQTLRDFEIVAIDDGSEDASAELLRAFGARVLSPGRVGLVAALNLGLAAARGALIARMDADDVMHPERLAAQVDLIDRGFDVVATQVELFGEAVRDGYREYVRWQNAVVTPEQIDANLYVESPFAHPSVMFRRGLGVYADGPFPEDYELWLRLHAAGKRMAKVPRVLLRWRDSERRASRNDPRYSREAFDHLRTRYLANDPRVRYAPRLVVWGAGQLARRRARLLASEGVRVDAGVDVDPRKIGRTVLDAPVHPYEWLEQTPRPLVLIFVTNHRAREAVEVTLRGFGYVAGRDYL